MHLRSLKGIAPDFPPNVFEPFRQEDAGPSRYRGGLGLGLAISKQLVELHGGQIVAESAGDGLGAKFSVTLPISTVAPAVELAERTARQFRANTAFDKPEHIRGLRVLVVDDEEGPRRLVAMILEDCGCKVTTAGSVAEAPRSFAERAPEVLLSDIGVPGENGYDLIRKVRALAHDVRGGVPAAALTAYTRSEDRRNMLNAGYSIHLPKPIEPAELVAVVATLSRFIQRG